MQLILNQQIPTSSVHKHDIPLLKLEALNKYIHVYILDKYLKINFAPCHVKLQHHIIMEEFFLAIKKLMLHWLVDA